jgi:pSer/pThr/pTyr-binding forkhead associated (FHA) protein
VQSQIPPTEVIGAAQPPAAWLVMRAGNRSGKQYGLQRGRNVVGRDGTQCEVIVDDATVSKRHAEIRHENGQFVLYDLASTNGTFVNNRRVQRQGLLDGDDVRIGHVAFVFKEVKIGRAN